MTKIFAAVLALACAWVLLGPIAEPADAHGRVVKIKSRTKLWVNKFCVSGRSIMRHSTRWEQVERHAGFRGVRPHDYTRLYNTYRDYKYGDSNYDTKCDVWVKGDCKWVHEASSIATKCCDFDDYSCRNPYQDRNKWKAVRTINGDEDRVCFYKIRVYKKCKLVRKE